MCAKAALFNIGKLEAVLAQRIERNVNAALLEISRDVLPEIGELQSGAGGVREALALRVAITAQIEHQAADGVRRIAAIAKHAVPIGIAVHHLVLAKRGQQIGKRLHGNIEGTNRARERNEDRVRRTPGVTPAQLILPPGEQLERASRVRNFIAQVVGPAAVGVKIVEVLVQASRQQPRHDIEVFVVRRRQAARVTFRFRAGAFRRGQFTRDFEFGRCEHDEGSGATLGRETPRYGITAVFNSPLRLFIRSKTRGNSPSGLCPVMKSLARMSSRSTAASASRIK